MTVTEAQRIAAEYVSARQAMRDAVARFETASRAYHSLPLSFTSDALTSVG